MIWSKSSSSKGLTCFEAMSNSLGMIGGAMSLMTRSCVASLVGNLCIPTSRSACIRLLPGVKRIESDEKSSSFEIAAIR